MTELPGMSSSGAQPSASWRTCASAAVRYCPQAVCAADSHLVAPQAGAALTSSG